MGLSETEVRRILHEAGLIEDRPSAGAREHPPRSFERAEPNQRWQSDIFTFLLRKHDRVYLTGFLDDHSRYLVSHCLAQYQRSAFSPTSAVEAQVPLQGCCNLVLVIAPLVLRCDRWRAHCSPEVLRVAREHGVLLARVESAACPRCRTMGSGNIGGCGSTASGF